MPTAKDRIDELPSQVQSQVPNQSAPQPPHRAPIVILGYGTAAASAVMALRENGYSAAIQIFTNQPEGQAPYSPVLTSYYAAGRIPYEQCFPWGMDFAERYNVTVFAGEGNAIRAIVPGGAGDVVPDGSTGAVPGGATDETSGDACARGVVETADGRRHPYSQCLIAIGAEPIMPQFAGLSTYQPLSLRTLEDAKRFKRVLNSGTAGAGSSGKKMLILGTSMVAIKAAEACLENGVEPTMVSMDPHVLYPSAHPVVAQRYADLLAERGVRLVLNTPVTDVLERAVSGATSCGAVKLFLSDVSDAFNQSDECAGSFDEPGSFDECLVAFGVRTNLQFLPEAYYPEPVRAIPVDERMRTTMPHVFAAGDCAAALDCVTGQQRPFGLWMAARKQGIVAGRAMAAFASEAMAAFASEAMAAFASEAMAATAAMSDQPATAAIASQPAAKPINTQPYSGDIIMNTIHMQDIVFCSAGDVSAGGVSAGDVSAGGVSAGDVSVSATRRIEIFDDHNTLRLFVYDGDRLVGFNMLSVVGPGQLESLIHDAGIYRQQIVNDAQQHAQRN